MAVASTTGMRASGYVLMDVGSAATFKCRALFTYDSVVDGTHLGNVQYVGPTQYNALTCGTGDTVQIAPEIRKASFAVNDLTNFKIRAATAAGTAKTMVLCGVDVWSSVPVFGTTQGLKVHNFGYSGNYLHAFIGARTVNDAGTTNGSPTLVSTRAAWTSDDVGAQVVCANVPAGTIITAVSGANATMNNNATGTVTAGSVSNPCTIQGQKHRWDASLNGCPMSLLPDLVVHSCWTNDITRMNTKTGADMTMTANLTSGSPNVVIASGNGLQTLDDGQLIYAVAGTGITAGTTIASHSDSTHLVMSANATANVTGGAITVGVPSSCVAQAIKNCLAIFHGGGIAGMGVSAYADELLVVPFEQGVTRLNGISTTSSSQADYRQAMHDWALANLIATLDIYQAWSAEGNTGYAAANADNLMDSGDASGFHEGPVGYRDMASRITRLLEIS
jgi:hypothetical protein